MLLMLSELRSLTPLLSFAVGVEGSDDVLLGLVLVCDVNNGVKTRKIGILMVALQINCLVRSERQVKIAGTSS